MSNDEQNNAAGQENTAVESGQQTDKAPAPAAPASETPRTRAITDKHSETTGLSGLAGYYNELLDHACQLERELAEAEKRGMLRAAGIALEHDETGESGYSTAHDIARAIERAAKGEG